MVQLWVCTLLLLASLCVVHTKPYEEEKHSRLLSTGYVYFEGVGYYRLAYNRPNVWAEARRQCQQEGATLAVVNSALEAETLRTLLLDYLSDIVEGEPENVTVHTGFHDIFIEGEYLTVRSEPIIMTGFIRWKVGHPIADELNNCGGFDIGMFLLDIPCNLNLPYICEIPEAR